MRAQWRLFLAALHHFTRLPLGANQDAGQQPYAAARFMPLVGALIGAAAGIAYWLGAQIWPTSIAVVLALLSTALLTEDLRAAGIGYGFVFAILMKYNALMALSAASLPFPLPANFALGLIMIAAHAASRALVVSMITPPTAAAAKPVSNRDLGFALTIGFIPAALMGIPGLIGLASALVARITYGAYLRSKRTVAAAAELDLTQQLTEVCFYLGALATWAYI